MLAICIVFVYSGIYIFSSILQIIDNSFSPVSQVSSNPVAVRVCNRKVLPSCGVYPGQLFKVPVVLYGQRNGSVPGIVNSTLKRINTSAYFVPLQKNRIFMYKPNIQYFLDWTI